MLDLVRGYYTTSMALYPDEKRTWQELHHALLLQQMLEHFLKGWPVLFVFHLDSKVAHSDTVWILHLLQITEHSFTHRQGFINVNGAQVYKLRLVYCPNINRLHAGKAPRGRDRPRVRADKNCGQRAGKHGALLRFSSAPAAARGGKGAAS